MRLLIGQPYRVEFLDHSENCGGTVKTVAYGELVARDRTTIRLVAWYTPGTDADQRTEYAIVRSAITSIVRLRPAR